ncbi:unnamed protein product [Rodentolepis nana]|uniref:Uncharacterized protein n=1 Tax=Rodentolepis nana TaxID=102285 RepID=A0A0R3TBD9_RODNA|nr:unnamed protein product [Rodentolepis nana]
MVITLRPLPLLTTSQMLTSTRLHLSSLSSSDGSFSRTISTSTTPQLSPFTGYDSHRTPLETGNSRITLRFECPSLRDSRTSSVYPMEITAGVRYPSKAYPYRSPKLQLTTAFQPTGPGQSSGKHTPEDFDHGLSQPNIRSTRTLNTDHCIWRNIQRGARQWTKYCLTRSAGKVHKHARSPQSYCLQLQQSGLSSSNTYPTCTQNPVSQSPKIKLPLSTS